ncbi:hypothetical protein ACFQ4K_10985 [Tistrella bauzanensis]
MQGSDTVTQALRYAPGVISQYGNVDLRLDWFTVRGFTPGVISMACACPSGRAAMPSRASSPMALNASRF